MIFCDSCYEPCKVVTYDNSFDYSGTHCTGGQAGTHHQYDELSSCCESDYTEGGTYLMCINCENEIEVHPERDWRGIRCDKCNAVNCWTDKY